MNFLEEEKKVPFEEEEEEKKGKSLWDLIVEYVNAKEKEKEKRMIEVV